MVAGEDAEAAGVLRQHRGDAELGREVGDRGRRSASRQVLVPARLGEVLVQVGGGLLDPRDEAGVGGELGRAAPGPGRRAGRPGRARARPALRGRSARTGRGSAACHDQRRLLRQLAQGGEVPGRTVRTVNRRMALTRRERTDSPAADTPEARQAVARRAGPRRRIAPERPLGSVAEVSRDSAAASASAARPRASPAAPRRAAPASARLPPRRCTATGRSAPPTGTADRGRSDRPVRAHRPHPRARRRPRRRRRPLARQGRRRARPCRSRRRCSARATTPSPPPPCSSTRTAPSTPRSGMRRSTPASTAGRATSSPDAPGDWTLPRRGLVRPVRHLGATTPPSRSPPASTSS